MLSRRIFLAILINGVIYTLSFINLGIAYNMSANAMPYPEEQTVCKINEAKPLEEIKLSKKSITWVQVCSCRSYYGIPHTCYYSSQTDYDYSCVSKCVREANQ